jgi:hypothetical protein
MFQAVDGWAFTAESRFKTRPVRFGFVVKTVAKRRVTGFSPSIGISPCQTHSTNTPFALICLSSTLYSVILLIDGVLMRV